LRPGALPDAILVIGFFCPEDCKII